MRKNRCDSVTAAVAAAQKERPTVPAHISLSDKALPFWNDVISSRNDWQEHELPFVAELATTWAKIIALESQLKIEGDIVRGKINAKFRMIDVLHKRTVSLMRLLQLHARAKRGEKRDVARRPTVVAADDPHGLLA